MQKQQRFNRTLLAWYRKHGRHDLPWRKTRDPYRILVSEVMLQQTQVSRVIPKYREFLKQYPNVRALAKTSLGDVLRIWSGLGYNRRAKYLKRCAEIVTADYAGRFPHEFETLIALPAIGIATAGAIRAYAFGQDDPEIDTNIRRILVRVFFNNRKRIPTDRELYRFAQSVIPRGKGREWNYAMLDVGAGPCKARGHSAQCPLNPFHGRVGDFRYKKPQAKFHGSNRYYRGQIIAALAAHPKGYSANHFKKVFDLDAKALAAIIRGLKNDGLAAVKGNKLVLP